MILSKSNSARMIIGFLLFALVFVLMPSSASASYYISGTSSVMVSQPGLGSNIGSFNSQESSGLSSGAFTYSYPIAIPNGRNNMQPKLVLTYNSQDTDLKSIFGYGWSIDIPHISRTSKMGVDKIYSENVFYSSLDGELKPISLSDGVHGIYGPRVENGNFNKYEFKTDDSWQITLKDGTTYIFGSDTNSREDDYNNTSHIFKWMVDEIRDANDNFIRYEYYKYATNDQIYIDKIYYTGQGITDGIFEINFGREVRTSVQRFFDQGFSLYTRFVINEILIKENSDWITKYELDYATGDNSAKSMLSSITQSGKDDQDYVTSLPATTFNYQTNSAGWTEDTNISLPYYFNLNGLDSGARFMDINSDGLLDIIQGRKYDSFPSFVNNGNGWSQSYWSVPTYFAPDEEGSRVVDVNGDGMTDIVRAPNYWDRDKYVFKNDHGSLTTYDWGDISIPQVDMCGATRFADVNGDGLPDILFSPWQSAERKVYINEGLGIGWEEDTSWSIPEAFINGCTDRGVRLVDLNGDGLVDIIKKSQYDSTYFYINTGSGWTSSSWNLPFDLYPDNGSRFADVNGDGLIDFIYARWESDQQQYDRYVYLNKGNGSWTSYSNWNIPVGFASNSNDTGVRLADVNGDDMIDIVYGYLNIPGSVDENHVYLNDSEKADLLIQINESSGEEIIVDYKASTLYRDQNNTLLNPQLQFSVYTVSQVTHDDGLGNEYTTDYKYYDGYFYYGDIYDKKFAGFSRVEEVKDDQKITTYYHQGNTTNANKGEYSDDYYKIGQPYRVEVYDDSTDTLLQQETYKVEDYDLGNERKFVYKSQEVKSDLTGTDISTATQYTYDNANGNLLTQTNLGKVTANLDTGAIIDITGDTKTTTYQYASNITDYILNKPKYKSVTNGTDTRTVNYYYDNLSYGQVSNGNLTKEDYLVNSTDIDRTYNSYGLMTSETDPEGNTTTITYDANYLYPYQITNDLSQVTTTTYNLLNGKVATSEAINGLDTTNTYDVFGRLTKVEISNPSAPAQLTIKQEITYYDNADPRYRQIKDYYDVGNHRTSYEYFDGLDRLLQKKIQTTNSAEWSTIDYTYDDFNNIVRESLPYFTSVGTRTSADLSKPAKTYTYDIANRVLTEVNPAGTTTYEYDGWTTTITNANDIDKDLTKDAYGNLVQVDEHNDASTYTTEYEYNVSNKLTKIIDALDNERNFVYDTLDNLTSQDMVHTTSEQNPDTITYTYDKSGNVLTENNFNGTTITYTYDDLNRVLTEIVDSVTKIAYTYDEGQINYGKLTTITYDNGDAQEYTYDILGRLSTSATTIDSAEYDLAYTYGLNQDAKQITYPNSFIVQNTYNSVGQLSQIQYNPGGGMTTLADSMTYNANEQLTSFDRANGVDTDYTYDASENYRLTRILSSDGVDNLQDLNYTYDDIGNILTITDNSDTDLEGSKTFTYDDLDRLLTASVSYTNQSGSNYSQTFTYNAIGNMISNTDLSTMTYGSTQSHQLTAVGENSLTYDDAGNLLSYDNMSYTWDYRDRMLTSQASGSNDITYYQYDFNNQRLVKTTETSGTPTVEERYIDKYYQIDDGSNTKSHIFLKHQKLATINNIDSPYYILTDHLQSSSILVDNSGDIAEISDFKQFGTDAYTSVTTDMDNDYTFTGKEKDSETSLQYFGARHMDNELARFVSVDPIIIDLHNHRNYNKDISEIFIDPQQLNSYSYARNNPVIYEDPTGEASLSAWILNPLGTAMQVIGARFGSMALDKGLLFNQARPASAELLKHSSSLNPDDVNADTDSIFADSIRNSSIYQTKLQDSLKNSESDRLSTVLNLRFDKDDAQTAFGKLDLYIDASKKDGYWEIDAHGSDVYDFSKQEYSNNLIDTAANLGYLGQKTGALSNFTTNIQFKDIYRTDKK